MNPLSVKMKAFDRKFDKMGSAKRFFLYAAVMVVMGGIAITGAYALNHNIIWKAGGACLMVLTSVYYAFGPLFYYKNIFSRSPSSGNTEPPTLINRLKKLGLALKNMDREFSEFSTGKRFFCLAMMIQIMLMIWISITLPCGYLEYFGVLDSNPGYHPVSKRALFFSTSVFTSYTVFRS